MPNKASQQSAGGMLPSLDNGRFIAALLVVLFHMSYMVYDKYGYIPLRMAFRGAHSGVEYFFVLSGFIILWTHTKDIGKPGAPINFARKRITRIIPLLWLTLLSWGTLRLIMPSEIGDELRVSDLLYDLLLLPHSGNQTLGIIWTLRREALFYLLFALFLWRPKIGFTAFVIWQLMILVHASTNFFTFGPEPAMLLGIGNLGFGMGLAVAVLVPRSKVRKGMPALLLGCIMYAAILAAEWHAPGPLDPAYRPWGMTANTLLYLIAAAIVVFGMATIDYNKLDNQYEFSSVKSVLKTLGNASYAMYLMHLPFGSVAIRIIGPLLPVETLLPILSAGAVAVSVVVHLMIERPLMSWLRQRREASALLSSLAGQQKERRS